MVEYERLNFINGGTPAINATALNHIEEGISTAIDAINDLEEDMSGKLSNTDGSVELKHLAQETLDYITTNSGGSGKGITDTAKNILITILKNAVYTTNQSDNITRLLVALNTTEDDTGGETPAVQTEALEIVPTTSYPDTTTFGYTEQETASWYIVVKQGSIKGGLLSVDFDTNVIAGFDANLYLFDSEGNPLKHTASGTGALIGDCTPTYYDAGSGQAGFAKVNGPFNVQIDDGCTFIACMRKGAGTSADGTITTNKLFAEWAVAGGIKFTVQG